VSPMTIVSAVSSSGWPRRNAPDRRCPAPPSPRPRLDVHRYPTVRAQRPERVRCMMRPPLAVGGTPSVPAAVALGQLEGRREPGRLVQRRLHVVVRVQQHRGRPSARQIPVHRLRAVRGVEDRHVLEASASSASATQRAASSHSLFGNCRGSATERYETSSASSYVPEASARRRTPRGGWRTGRRT